MDEFDFEYLVQVHVHVHWRSLEEVVDTHERYGKHLDLKTWVWMLMSIYIYIVQISIKTDMR